MKKLLSLSVVALLIVLMSACCGNSCQAQRQGYHFTETDTTYVEDILEGYNSSIINLMVDTKFVLDTDEQDEFTGDMKKITNWNIVGGDKNCRKNFQIRLAKINEQTVMFVRTTGDLGCAGTKENSLMIKFVDGEVIKFETDEADIDCGKTPQSIYIIDNSKWNKLKSTKIDMVRFTQSKHYQDYYAMFPDVVMEMVTTIEK